MADTHGVSEKVMAERVAAIELELTAPMAAWDGPVTARTLAVAAGIHGPRETVRRRIREVVAYARETQGLRICANGQGYWLARSHKEWADYEASVVAKAKFAFVKVGRTKRAVTERHSGQGMLFETRTVGW